MKINIDNGKVLEDIITDEEENIYQKLARATARAVDINLGKTTLADLLDGYTKSITLQERINKTKNNILKDISMIKTHNMSKEEIIMRLKETIKILGGKE